MLFSIVNRSDQTLVNRLINISHKLILSVP